MLQQADRPQDPVLLTSGRGGFAPCSSCPGPALSCRAHHPRPSTPTPPPQDPASDPLCCRGFPHPLGPGCSLSPQGGLSVHSASSPPSAEAGEEGERGPLAATLAAPAPLITSGKLLAPLLHPFRGGPHPRSCPQTSGHLQPGPACPADPSTLA